MKRCRRCGVVKPLDDYSPNRRTTDGRQPSCRVCVAAYERERSRTQTPEQRERRLAARRAWRQRPDVRFRTAMLERARKLGVTTQELHELFDRQRGRCPMCPDDAEPLRWSTLHADHDHATGRLRGLLCARHNIGLGHFGDDPAQLEAAVAYLRSGGVA